jgi:predicted NBD/HSP70 family sugar kinase
MSPARLPELMRQPSRSSVLATIQQRGPISRVELAQLLDLNPATITRITRTLLDEDLIREIGEGSNQGAGRKPVLLTFNHRAQLLIAVHVQAGSATGVVADLAGTFLIRRTVLLSSQHLSPALMPLFEDLIESDPSYGPRLAAACVGGVHLHEEEENLSQTLSSTLGIPVITAETVELAALGEAEWGAVQGQRHFALFYLGGHSQGCAYLHGETRLGGLGLALDGTPLAARLCDAGLVTLARNALETGERSALHAMAGQARLSANMIFEAARQHDPLAQRIVNSAAQDIAWAAAWLSNALALNHVVLGGSWVQAASLLIPTAAAHLASLTAKPPLLVPVGLGDDASILGAVWLMLNHLNQTSKRHVWETD